MVRAARNKYGYIPPESSRGYPRTGVTYLYYTYSQINDNANDDCNRYIAWNSVLQSIGVSRLTIT